MNKPKDLRRIFFRVENLNYEQSEDQYLCPNNKRLNYKETITRKTEAGFLSTRRIYQSEGCEGCPLRASCHENKYDRKIEVSHSLNEHKTRARELLNSPKGKTLRSQRCVDVEQTFAQIKHNMQFKRFLLKGMKKVNIEFAIIAIAHNIKKRWVKAIKKDPKSTCELLIKILTKKNIYFIKHSFYLSITK